MSDQPTDFQGSIEAAIRPAIQTIDGAVVDVAGSGGHFTIAVVSPVFAAKGLLDSQRLVYSAITHLMKGDRPPVHAVDSLKTRTP